MFMTFSGTGWSARKARPTGLTTLQILPRLELGAHVVRTRPLAHVLESARSFQRNAQFLIDFIEAENSMGFHAPQEAARVLVKSLD